MKKNAVKVCVRTRPTQNFAQDNLIIDQEHNTIQIKTNHGDDTPAGMPNNKQNSFKFKFDHVFHNASQIAVYDLYARDTVLGVVEGINGSIMSYGQTGSGKTFTMLGDAQSYEHRGVAPRALSQLFNEVNSRIEIEFRISCTYMEIYNERIFDLLADMSQPDQAADFTIAEEKDGRGTFVRGLAEIEVTDESSALSLLFSGGLSRTIATHKLNKRSNRSHSVFTVYLQQRQRSGVSERVVHSKLHLIDLAGSERLKKTMDSMDGLTGNDVTKRESMAINQSLTYLEQCVVALARKGQSHVPYRQSKLTNVLKDCLGANCNTIMIACMWGEENHLEETISTLRLASRMMRVQNESVSVETVDPSALITKQEKIIRALKQELLMHDALVERTGVSYEPYTPEQQESISQMLERYVDAPELAEEDVLNITNYRQMLEICKQFKKKLTKAREEAIAAREEAYADIQAVGTMNGANLGRGGTAMGGGNAMDFTADSKIAGDYDPKAPTVGEIVSNGRTGFALGLTSADSRPPAGIEGLSKYMASPKYAAHGASFAKDTPGGKGMPLSPTRSQPSMVDFSDYQFGGGMAQFEAFVKTDGRDLFREFSDLKSACKDLRSKVKEFTSMVNDAKYKIDDLQDEIESRKASRMELAKKNSSAKAFAKDEIVDEEEMKVAKALKEAKMSYKNGFEQLQKYKKSVAEAQSRLNSTRDQLTFSFDDWNNEQGFMGSPGSRMMDSPSRFSNNAGDATEEYPQNDLDQLDDQEAFDRLEVERVLANDPDSLGFFNAQKTRRANMTQNSVSLRQIQRNKRFT